MQSRYYQLQATAGAAGGDTLMSDVGVAERTDSDFPMTHLTPVHRLMAAIGELFPGILTDQETSQVFEVAQDGLEVVPGVVQTFMGEHGVQLTYLEARLAEAEVSLDLY